MIVPILGNVLLPGRVELLKIPMQLLVLSLGCCNLLFLKSENVIYANVFAMIMLAQRSVAQAAAVKLRVQDPVGGIRITECAYTIGYCLSSLWSGTAYNYGSWAAICYLLD
jgi:hypothetical protein